MLLCFTLTLLLFKSTSSESTDKELIQLSIIIRHGQRTPERFYPEDQWKYSEYWPEGIMQLTSEGAMQLQATGEFLRERYYSFIPTPIKNEQILVRSTDTTRTVESAKNLLLTLFPNQTLPIEVTPMECISVFDPFLTCIAFEEEMERIAMSPEEIAEEKKLERLYNWLSLKLGDRVFRTKDVEVVYTNFLIEQERNLKLPVWAVDVFPEPVRTVAGKFMIFETKTALTQRLRYGVFVKDIVDHAIAADNNNGLIYIYASHDVLVASLLNILKAYDGSPPGFAAMLVFEVYRDKVNGAKEIRLLYRNVAGSDLKNVYIPGCGESCSLESFMKIVDPIIPKNLRQECLAIGNNSGTDLTLEHASECLEYPKDHYHRLTTFIVFSSLAVGMMFIICFLMKKYYTHVNRSPYKLIRGNDNF